MKAIPQTVFGSLFILITPSKMLEQIGLASGV
jgi:hypothetical protein